MPSLILIIDDDTDDQVLFSSALQQIDPLLTLSLANSGVDALIRLNNNPDFTPDFIFLDLNLPVLDGLDSLQVIRQIHRLQQTPVFLFSNSASPQKMDRAMELGATGFITKPAGYQALIHTLSQVLQQGFSSPFLQA